MRISGHKVFCVVQQIVNNATRNNVNRFFSKSARLYENSKICSNDGKYNETTTCQENTSENCQEEDEGYEKQGFSRNNREGFLDEQKSEIPVTLKEVITSERLEIRDLNRFKRSSDVPDIFDECKEDLSHLTRYPVPTYNFAAYANESETIKQLVNLGVDLSRIERRSGVLEMILPLDFERDIMPYVRFLHDNQLPAKYLGNFLTRNPYILKEDMDHLNSRINYLKYHNFTKRMIQNILIRAPTWLSFTTENIDRRFGYFQNTFRLSGDEIRSVTSDYPKIIINKMANIYQNTFSIKEEMGFDLVEMKSILLKKPIIWNKSSFITLQSFDYLHNQMELSHKQIAQEPAALLCRRKRLEHRYQFLKSLKRIQFDPKKPLYVSLTSIIEGTDAEFCLNVAKAPLDTYNDFLKTF